MTRRRTEELMTEAQRAKIRELRLWGVEDCHIAERMGLSVSRVQIVGREALILKGSTRPRG